MVNFPGQIRPSQIISTFGPGSIMDLADDSVMILGLEFWPSYPNQYTTINEPRLEQILHIGELRIPVSHDELNNVPCSTFPRMRICVDCSSIRPSFKDVSKDKFTCQRCGSEKTYPSRLIVACKNGHIDDFPWYEWAHEGEMCTGTPDLYLINLGKSSALADFLIGCRKKGEKDKNGDVATGCGRRRSLSGALGPNALRDIAKLSGCSGMRPWLRDQIKGCLLSPIGLQRGGSNVYFSVTESALAIPPYTGTIYTDLSKHWKTISSLLSVNRNTALEVIKTLLPNYAPELVLMAVEKLEKTTPDPRSEEWIVLNSGTPINEPDIEIDPQPLSAGLKSWLEHLACVNRLREVRAIRGFTRIDPPDPEKKRETPVLPLTAKTTDWLPAIEVYGEGIFFSLNEDTLSVWESKTLVQERIGNLFNIYNEWRNQQGWAKQTENLPRLILLHTLSHVLIRQLGLESGYSSASIRERIFSNAHMDGILLYTASDGSDGSLGGLSNQGLTQNFESILRNAVASSEICSSDPLCYENDPLVTRTLNGSACHLCSFVSETSCEFSNRLLDRQTIMPQKDSQVSFFAELN